MTSKKSKNESRRFPLGKKMFLFVGIVLFVAISSMVASSYINHIQMLDDYFKRTTADIATTVSHVVNGDYVENLISMVDTPEYQALREEAIAQDNEQLIEDWLQENGLLERYTLIRNILGRIKEHMDVKYLYVESDATEETLFLIDPDEDLFNLGSTELSSPEYAGLVGNIHIDPMVSNGKYGWLCSAYEPVYNSKGEAVASVGADLDMNDVVAERRLFLSKMILNAFFFILLLSVISDILVRRHVTRPLEKLTAGLRAFSPAADGDYEKSHVLNFTTDSRDEIHELCSDVRFMQTRIVDALVNLTAVTAEKERIGAELNVAAQIQADMLPRVFPPFPGREEFEIYATMDPAKEVGGDFYDFFFVDEDHLCLVIADVSGKGVPAALFMVIAKSLIKNRAQMGDSPAAILGNVNMQLCEGNEAELFVTVWLAVLEISTGKGIAANAGHEHPVVRRAGGNYELVVYRHSPAVATLEGIRFREHPFELNPGDSLFVCTDGVGEATNTQNELFGNDRLLEALNRHPDAGPKEQLAEVNHAIQTFVGEAPQFDDITMLGFYYRGKK